MTPRSALSIGMALTIALTACGQSSDGGDDEAIGGEFNIAWSAQPPTLDPLMTTANSSRDIARNFLEPLLTMDNEGEVHPVLAEDYEISDDGMQLTITLREGVSFHDGSTMEAEDVVASLERWIDVTNVGQNYFSEATVDSLEEGAVTLSFPEQMWAAPLLLADQSQMPFIMPADVVEAAPAEGVQEPVGTGPYEFTEWITDQHVRIDRFEDYAPPSGMSTGDAGPREAGVETIYYHFISDPSTRLTGIQTGEYDAADVPWDNAEILQDENDVNLTIGDYGLSFAIFNKSEGIMADPNMRRAVLAAIEPEQNMQSAFSSDEFYGLEGALAPEGTAWHVDSTADELRLGQDLDEAEELLEAADYDGEEIRILTTREYDHTYNAAVVLQEQLEQAGMNTDLNVMDWATYLEYREDPANWDIANTNDQWRAIPATWSFLLPTYAGWTESEEIDEAIQGLVYSADEEDALSAMEELQQATDEYLPIAIFGNLRPVMAVRSDFEGHEYAYFAGDLFYNIRPAD